MQNIDAKGFGFRFAVTMVTVVTIVDLRVTGYRFDQDAQKSLNQVGGHCHVVEKFERNLSLITQHVL